MKQRIPKVIYNKIFSAQAVKQVMEDELSAKETGCHLSLLPSTLSNRVKMAQTCKFGEIGKIQHSLTEVELGLTKDKRELAEVKMEGVLIKKTARLGYLPPATFERQSYEERLAA